LEIPQKKRLPLVEEELEEEGVEVVVMGRRNT
jgi:hypothetical protein